MIDFSSADFAQRILKVQDVIAFNTDNNSLTFIIWTGIMTLMAVIAIRNEAWENDTYVKENT